MNSKRLLLIICTSVYTLISHGQQDATNAQYVMNKLLINPAYAGYKENANFTLVHRSQWVGFKGAPSTQVLSFDMPMKKDKLAIGATIMHDKIGPTSTFGAELNITYRVRLSNRATMAFGAKASCSMYQANLTDLVLTSDYYNQQDELFMYNTNGLILPNAGFGFFYYKKDHYFGFSVPKLLRNKLVSKTSELYNVLNGRQEPTGYITAGKIWKINKQVKIQPNLIIKGQINSPLSIGLYFNVLLVDQFNVGAFFHYGEVGGLMFQWQMDKQWKLGYSFDVPTSTLIQTNWGSHELAVTYCLATRRKRVIYPRYF
ncbi:MAG: type IX secretion system membrane protein PorP/SprF [Flavobacteriales bacterium]|nr:type IX secretion system membrane protein PorP/SprF [Flavobacteriales bacterium]